MKTQEQDIAELKATVAELRRTIDSIRKESRPAAPLKPRHGRYFGITADVLNEVEGQPVSVDVTVHIINGNEWEETATIIEDVRAFDDDTEIPLGAKVCVIWYETNWVLLPLGSAEIIHFELKETMSFGGHALAHKLVYSGGSWVIDGDANPVRVYDWYGDMWAGEEEYRGLAISRGGDTSTETIEEEEIEVALYDVVWMERIASKIDFVLTKYMSEDDPNEADGTVTRFDHQGEDPGSTVTLHDPDNVFPDAHSGAKGTAYYQHAQGRYVIENCQRLALHANAALVADCCGDTTTGVTGFAVIAVGEYVGSPDVTPTTVNNPRGHAGVAGDSVLLLRTNDAHDETSEWEIIDVTKHMTQVITDVQVDTGTLKLQKKKRNAYVEWCDDTTPSWEDYHTGTECE